VRIGEAATNTTTCYSSKEAGINKRLGGDISTVYVFIS
jgi:hypothetical protein